MSEDRASDLAYWAKEGTTNVGRCMAVDDLLRMVRELQEEIAELRRLLTLEPAGWPYDREL